MLLYSLLKTNSSFSKSLEHIDLDVKSCIICIHYNPEIAVYSKNVSCGPSHLSTQEIIYKVCIFNSNCCLLTLLGSWAVTLTEVRAVLMYISFRFNRRAKKLEGESHLREYEYSTTVGSEINGNTHFSHGFGDTERSGYYHLLSHDNRSCHCKFSAFNFACVWDAIVGTHRVSSNGPKTWWVP